MRMILAALPLLAALGACSIVPPAGPYGPSPYPGPASIGEGYRAIGTEPFWDLTMGRDLVFNDRGLNLQVVQPAPSPIIGIAGEIYQTPRINVNIVHASCSDGMSDRRYPDQVQVTVDRRAYRGCGGPSSFFAAEGDVASVPKLAQTQWRVTAINGRPVPPVNYTIKFDATQLSAKFGCNGFSGNYGVTRDLLRPGVVNGTLMACPDMSFENAGKAVLSLPMTIADVGEKLTLSNRNGAITMVQVR